MSSTCVSEGSAPDKQEEGQEEEGEEEEGERERDEG